MSTTLNRRALVKGAAWSVPVIALAVAAPQAAASTVGANYSCIPDPSKPKKAWIVTGPEFEGSKEMSHSDAMKHAVYGPICRSMGENPGAGK